MKSEWVRIKSDLSDVGEYLLSPGTGSIYQIEKARAIDISVTHSRSDQQTPSAQREQHNQEKSTNLLKLFGQLRIILERLEGYEYKITESRPDPNSPYVELKVFQEPAIGNFDTLIEGEKYYHFGSSDFNYYSHFILRWPIACRVKDFIEAIAAILEPGDSYNPKKLRQQKLEIVDQESQYFDQGILIYLRNGIVLGCSVEYGFVSEWQLMRLGNMLKLINNTLKHQGQDISKDDIVQYRVNTKFGHFVFDIKPAEFEHDRYCSIISDFDLAPQIVFLYKKTGILFVTPEKLLSAFRLPLMPFRSL